MTEAFEIAAPMLKMVACLGIGFWFAHNLFN
jgi:hypothetical protein